jgi:3-dehydroquinate synthase
VHSIRFKAAVVTEDELETGRRAILNYGHTVGHGLEAATGYGLPHGEAISAGMVAAAHLSRERFGTDLVPLHKDLLRAADLPHKAPAIRTKKVLAAMARDKKRLSHDGALRFVLLENVGEPSWGVPVSDEEASRAIEAVVG